MSKIGDKSPGIPTQIPTADSGDAPVGESPAAKPASTSSAPEVTDGFETTDPKDAPLTPAPSKSTAKPEDPPTRTGSTKTKKGDLPDYDTLSPEVAGIFEDARALLHNEEDLHKKIKHVSRKFESGMKALRTLTNITDKADSGLVSVAKVIGILDSANAAGEFVAALSAPPAGRSLKIVTGIVDGARSIRNAYNLDQTVGSLEENISTDRKIMIISKLIDNQDLEIGANRNLMVDNFLLRVLKSAKQGQELNAIRAGIETASGACVLAGTVTGNPAALGAGAGLAVVSGVIEAGEVVHKEGEIIHYRKKRKRADSTIVEKAFDNWMTYAQLGDPDDVDEVDGPIEEMEEPPAQASVAHKEFVHSIWFKEDIAHLIVARIRERPESQVNKHILELCGFPGNALTPKELNKLSKKGQHERFKKIEDTLSGRSKTVKGKFFQVKRTFNHLKEKLGDTFSNLRNQISELFKRHYNLAFSKITDKTSELQAVAEERGMDSQAIVDDLFQRALDEGPDATRAMREMLDFTWKPTGNGSALGRNRTRLDLLQALHDNLQEFPDVSIEEGCTHISGIYDKHEMAQKTSLLHSTITTHTDQLKARAAEKGMDTARVPHGIFEEAIAEGHDAVNALHVYLSYSRWDFGQSIKGTTPEGRIDARLHLLNVLDGYRDENPSFSMEKAILSCSDFVDKAGLAQRYSGLGIPDDTDESVEENELSET